MRETAASLPAKRGSDAAVIRAQTQEMAGYSGNTCGCRSDYGVNKCTQRWSIRASFKVRDLAILRTSFEFIRGHCGKVANKAPPGSCNRCLGASRDPFSTSGSRSIVATHLQYRTASITLSIHTGLRLSLMRVAHGDGHRPFIDRAHFQTRRPVLHLSKEV